MFGWFGKSQNRNIFQENTKNINATNLWQFGLEFSCHLHFYVYLNILGQILSPRVDRQVSSAGRAEENGP